MTDKAKGNKPRARKQVLSDHRKLGRKLIPPLLQIPNLQETSFRSDGIPEIIWIAALLRDLGIRSGIEAAGTLTDLPFDQERTPNLAIASGYYDLPAEIKQRLTESDVLRRADVTATFRRLSRLFPNFPMSFLAPTGEQETQADVQWLRATMEPLYIKTSKPMVFALATAVHIALATGKLRLCVEGSRLEQLNALSDYPDTDESLAVAAVVRASFHIFYAAEPDIHKKWARAFWERCWSLGDCEQRA